MMVGGRGRLTAWEFDNGREREVGARWTAQGDVISITSNGVVTARRLGNATVRAQAGDQSGTEIVHVVTSVAGTWRGSVSILDCWQRILSVPDPCKDRRGQTGPLVLMVAQSAAAELGNLTGTLAVFTPPAIGNYAGLLDSSGTFFIQGHVERPLDRLSAGVTLRWQLEGERLVPMNFEGRTEDTIDLQLAVRNGADFLSFEEIWKISTLTR
jgi:hypothetical protein